MHLVNTFAAVRTAALCAMALLTGCQSQSQGIEGKTLYSVAAWDNRNNIEANDVLTISFGSDGNS